MRVIAASVGQVVGEAGNGIEALECAGKVHLDIVILDVSMPVMGGFEVARILRERSPDLLIFFASHKAERPYADEAYRIGANGFIAKGAAVTELPDALLAASEGRFFRSPSAV